LRIGQMHPAVIDRYRLAVVRIGCD
jgi:hypothetical protein